MSIADNPKGGLLLLWLCVGFAASAGIWLLGYNAGFWLVFVSFAPLSLAAMYVVRWFIDEEAISSGVAVYGFAWGLILWGEGPWLLVWFPQLLNQREDAGMYLGMFALFFCVPAQLVGFLLLLVGRKLVANSR